MEMRKNYKKNNNKNKFKIIIKNISLKEYSL